MNRLVMIYKATIDVLSNATTSASLSEIPSFWPNALAQSLHIDNPFLPNFAIINHFTLTAYIFDKISTERMLTVGDRHC